MTAVWSALPLPWQACLEEAWAAYCAGTFPIGAALVDGTGRILARSRNEIHDRDGEAQLIRNRELAHAELRTLFAVERDRIDSNCTPYSLLEPCPPCIGALYMSGVRKLCFAARDPLAGSTNLVGATAYMRRKPIRIAQSEVKGWKVWSSRSTSSSISASAAPMRTGPSIHGATPIPAPLRLAKPCPVPADCVRCAAPAHRRARSSTNWRR